jgi:hypothetical protein
VSELGGEEDGAEWLSIFKVRRGFEAKFIEVRLWGCGGRIEVLSGDWRCRW